jgi:hypothetical protein
MAAPAWPLYDKSLNMLISILSNKSDITCGCSADPEDSRPRFFSKTVALQANGDAG